MSKTQTRNGIKRVSENVQENFHPAWHYRDEEVEAALVGAGYMSLADWLKLPLAVTSEEQLLTSGAIETRGAK